jgi:hypothetical protein
MGGAAKVSVGFGFDLQRNQMVAILRGIDGARVGDAGGCVGGAECSGDGYGFLKLVALEGACGAPGCGAEGGW